MVLGGLLAAFGGLICALNFWLSFLRYPLFRLRGGKREDYRHISGFPLMGSLTLAIAWVLWIRKLHSAPIDALVAVLALFDSLGPHVLACVMLREWTRSRR